MGESNRGLMAELRGASRLVIEATRGVTGVVEAMHARIAGAPGLLGMPFAGTVRGVTGLVYGMVRGVTGLVGLAVDSALVPLAPLLGRGAPSPEREAVLSALNGVLGDHLEATANPLAIEMQLRSAGHPLELEREALRSALPRAGGNLLVLVHGAAMTDRQWLRQGHDHGTALARDLGFTPLYLRYNSGRHVSTNGRAFAELLERLVAEWPVPVAEVMIIGHSMGGLVARSACDVAAAAGHRWRARLSKLVFLGTPHHGAPLERAGNFVDHAIGLSSYSAPLARLGKIRSAGVTDLRYGNVCEADWKDRDRFARGGDRRRVVPLPAGVQCFAAAATKATRPGRRLPGDGLVSVASALGRHARPEMTLPFPEGHQWIGFGMRHFDLLSRPEVYEVVRGWLRG